MTDLLCSIRTINQLGDRSVAEPFAGGAGASLSLLYREDAHEIHINDADPAIHDFWWTVTNRPRPFLAMLRSTRVSMAEWNRQRNTYRRTSGVSRLRRGFAAFYLNRCNHSGIIMNGGPIGGVGQTGQWKLGARFNKPELGTRCAKVAEYGERIHVSRMDAIDFIDGQDQDRTFFFIDPPYYVKGETLYMNNLDHAYHQGLADRLHGMDNAAWVLTYDDCPEIRALYAGWANIRPFSLQYAAAERRRGMEILIAPRWMRLPEEQTSAAIDW
jgi:DNA adenine methylase